MFDYRCTRTFDLRDKDEGQTYCRSEKSKVRPTYNEDFQECKTPREFFAPAPKKKMRFLKDVYKGWKY
jgi:hypothetical protein